MNKNEKEIEIILNGVNVSGCKWLDNNKIGLLCALCDYKVVCCSRCAGNPDCYYKQLKREKAQYDKVVEQNRSLQQEIKELKEQFDTCKLNYHNDMEMNKAEVIGNIYENPELLEVKNE